jgi:hypothetical protein
MSDTPETDDQPIIYALNELQYQILCVDSEFARKLERERDEARAELAEWKILNLWGGTPEIVHAFIKGQQMRIWECQEIEKTCEQLERERDEARRELENMKETKRDLMQMVYGRNWVEQDLLKQNAKLRAELEQLKEGGK